MFFWDPTFLLLIPAMIFAMWAQGKVKSNYRKFSQVQSRSGMTGADIVQAILRSENIELAQDPSSYPAGTACGLEAIPGHLTDHYDPRSRTLRLSEDIYHGRSVAALGIAAHEVGHAIQHARSYTPLLARNVVYPLCSFGSIAAWPLFLGGFFLGIPVLLRIGILFFTFAVAFSMITLPVEYNASNRALRALAEGGHLDEDEMRGARKVLSAAALTYVAATAVAVMHLVRMLILSNSRN